jgi:hypothetical protein
MNDYPVLAIFMRNDLESLNPGKAVAQGSHAANQMETVVRARKDLKDVFASWKQDAQGFGTALVFEDKWYNIESVVNMVVESKNPEVVSGVVLDPTYPLRDGQVTHHIPLHTCAWIFGMKSEVSKYTGGFSLMR